MFPAINKLSGLKSFMENVARYIIQTKNNFNRDPLNYLLLFLFTIKFIFTNLSFKTFPIPLHQRNILPHLPIDGITLRYMISLPAPRGTK